MSYHEDNASFVMYKEWEELFESLDSNDERAALIMAIFAFVSRNENPDFHGALKMAFLMMSKQLDRDGTKWEKRCAKNAENVRKRWEKANAKKSNGIESNTTVYDCIRTDTNYTDNDNDNVNDNVNDNDNKINNGQKTAEQAEPVRSIPAKTADFERLWALYPRKEGKKEAFAAFQRSVKKGTTVEVMEKGINSYIKHIKDCSIERQYIKKGSTYFQQEAWNDVYDDKRSNPVESSYNPRVAFSPFGAIDPETGEKLIYDDVKKTWTPESKLNR